MNHYQNITRLNWKMIQSFWKSISINKLFSLVLIWRPLPKNEPIISLSMSMNKWPSGDAVWERERHAEQRLERKRYLLISSEKSQRLAEFLHQGRGSYELSS